MATRATSATGEAGIDLGLRGHSRRRRGFTLIELMVVLAIIVLIAASIPYAMNRMLPSRRVAVAADRLVADIRWLQAQAALTSAPARLALSESGYRLEGGGQARQVELPRSTQLRFRARGETRSIDRLVVHPDGTSLPGEFEIVDSGRRLRVEISMLTGRARRVG